MGKCTGCALCAQMCPELAIEAWAEKQQEEKGLILYIVSIYFKHKINGKIIDAVNFKSLNMLKGGFMTRSVLCGQSV